MTASPDANGSSGGSPPDVRLVLAPGARAAEAWLVEVLRAEVDAARRDPARLARPLRVVVPSRSLREHLASAVAREIGSVLGVQVQTLHGLACEVLERAGDERPPGDALYPILVRRAAAAEPALAGALGGLEDGYASVLGAVSDFLDAGLGEGLAGSAAQRLAAQAGAGASEDETLRALALLSVAERVRRELAGRGRRRPSDRLAAAVAHLRAGGAALLPSRGVLVHGFSDATGVALDLLEVLCRSVGAAVVLDLPPEPAGDGGGGASVRFSRRLAERVSLAGAGPPREAGAAAPPPSLALLEAVGADAEVRAVALRVRALLDGAGGAAPCPPERIGIVARRLDPYGVPLRRHLRRLAIPFSASAAGPGGALARRLGAVVELLRRGSAATVDRWLDARSLAPGLRADLRVALHLVGAGRLGDVARLDPAALLGDRETLRLEVPLGFGGGEAEEREDGVEEGGAAADTAARPAYTRRRSLSRRQLEAAVADARALAALLGARREAPVAQHAARLREAIAPQLGLVPGPAQARGGGNAAAGGALERALAALEEQLPADEPLDSEAWVRALERALAGEAAEPLGGCGAGVQVLDVTAARARTFAHLFVLGMNRDVFPRTVPGDPLLPDPLRAALRAVLPDMPVKESGYDEERHLFAQLLSASPHVTLSWQAAGDDGKPRSPSPLVERLRWIDATLAPVAVPAVFARPPDGAPGAPSPRPAHEHAVLAALHAGREAFAAVWPVAVSEDAARVRSDTSEGDAAALAAAQLAALRELDRYGAPDEPLGPYIGFIGPVVEASDPRRRDLYVTTAEGIARCGWKHFLERILAVAPAPDALTGLAGVERSVVGQAVHRALEEIGRAAGVPQGTLAEALSGDGAAVRWPEDAALDAIALAASERTLREEMHFSLPGLARATAVEVARSLRLVRAADAPEDRRLLGVELRGAVELSVAGERRWLHFRADRAERVAGEIVVTDVKTGSLIRDTVVKGEKKQLEHHLGALRSGTHLQAAVYAAAASAVAGRPAIGRYLFAPPAAEEAASYALRSDDAAAAESLAATLDVVLGAREAGVLLPRLVDPGGSEPKLCAWCQVAEACARGDSGLRGRLERWGRERESASRPGDTDAERRMRALWWLGAEAAE